MANRNISAKTLLTSFGIKGYNNELFQKKIEKYIENNEEMDIDTRAEIYQTIIGDLTKTSNKTKKEKETIARFYLEEIDNYIRGMQFHKILEKVCTHRETENRLAKEAINKMSKDKIKNRELVENEAFKELRNEKNEAKEDKKKLFDRLSEIMDISTNDMERIGKISGKMIMGNITEGSNMNYIHSKISSIVRKDIAKKLKLYNGVFKNFKQKNKNGCGQLMWITSIYALIHYLYSGTTRITQYNKNFPIMTGGKKKPTKKKTLTKKKLTKKKPTKKKTLAKKKPLVKDKRVGKYKHGNHTHRTKKTLNACKTLKK